MESITFGGIVGKFLDILNPVVPLLVTLATLYFIWGLVKFIRASGDEGELKQGKQMMTWGIVGMFVLLALWGLVGLLSATFGDILNNEPVDINDVQNLIK